MIDVTKLHRDLCGQAAESAMLARRLPSQTAYHDGNRRAYLHAARMLLMADGTAVDEAWVTTDLVSAEVLAIHERYEK